MIVVDVGNTSLSWGIEERGELIKVIRISTQEITFKRLNSLLQKLPSHKTVIVCSVVPHITLLFKKIKKRKIIIVGEDIKVPIRCFYNKKQIGQDRLLSAFSARKKSPLARLVIDFGTAITFDFLSEKGEYLGGIIFPGIGLCFKTLSLNCALLPENIRKEKKLSFIPKNTSQSINKGIIEGISILINSWVEKYKKRFSLDKKEKIIITGGEATFVLKKLNFPFLYFPHLILEGLIILGKEKKTEHL